MNNNSSNQTNELVSYEKQRGMDNKRRKLITIRKKALKSRKRGVRTKNANNELSDLKTTDELTGKNLSIILVCNFMLLINGITLEIIFLANSKHEIVSLSINYLNNSNISNLLCFSLENCL